MPTRNPAYLFLRNGIYYFQVRLPKRFMQNNSERRLLIRRSTKTGNRREALIIARRWIVKLTDKDDDFLKNMESQSEHEKELYARGKYLFLKLLYNSGPDSQELWIKDQIIDDMNAFDKASLEHYQNECDQLPAVVPQHYIEQFHSGNAIPSPANFTAKVVSPQFKLSEILRKYTDFNMRKSRPWTNGSKEKFIQQITLMIDMVGDPLSPDFTHDLLVSRFLDDIQKIPKNIAAKKNHYYNGNIRRPFSAIIDITERNQFERLSATTIANYAQNIISFLKWAEGRKYIEAGLHIALEELRKLDNGTAGMRDRYSKEELKRLFENSYYREGSLMKKPFRHWSLLLGLYTGAREGEICQLHLEDILYDAEHGVWVIDFNAKGTKTLKNRYSARVTPIHKDLIALGFLDYYNTLKQRGEEQLFPTLKPTKNGDEWGRTVSRWYNGYKVKGGRQKGYKELCGIVSTPAQRKDFHSFRHTLIDEAKQNFSDGQVMREITGHAIGPKDVHAEAYEKQYNLQNRKDTMDRLKFDLDINSIKKWPK